jgi:hypothetical protein
LAVWESTSSQRNSFDSSQANSMGKGNILCGQLPLLNNCITEIQHSKI